MQTKRKNRDADKTENESESEDPSRSPKSDEESSSVSDDSLEVVVVKRSLEKKSEKIISGVRFKTIREASKIVKDSLKSDRSNYKKLIKKQCDKLKVDKTLKKTAIKQKSSNQEQKSMSKNGDTTSQDSVEQVTVIADIHKSEGLDTSKGKNVDTKKDEGIEQETEEQMKNKMDDILGKADELQNALLAKAADLKKDMEEMRYCMSHKSDEKEKNEEFKGKGEKNEKNNENNKDISNSKSDQNEPTIKDVNDTKKDNSINNQIILDKQLEISVTNETLNLSDKNEKECGISIKIDKAKEEAQKLHEKTSENVLEKDLKEMSQDIKRESITQEVLGSRRKSFVKESDLADMKQNIELVKGSLSPKKDDKESTQTLEEVTTTQVESTIPG
jgi:hypothetical protein